LYTGMQTLSFVTGDPSPIRVAVTR
jgi:hypothetical protein